MSPTRKTLKAMLPSWWRMAFIWLFFFSSGGSLLALDPAKTLSQYNCYSWTRQSGLPVNGIRSIAQSKDGYLWLGTSLGLVRFDGLEFNFIDLAQIPGIRSTIVTSIAPASKGGVWVGLENSSFGYYDGKSFSLRGKQDWGGLGLNVQTLDETKDGSVWLAAQREAAWITPQGKYAAVMSYTEEFKIYILFHFADSAGRQWISTADNGLYYWQGGKLARFSVSSSSAVLTMTEDAGGNLWMGTEKGLHCYDSQLNRKEIVPFTTSVRTLLADRRGNLWIGTDDQGLVRSQRGGEYTYLKKSDGLASDHVTALMEDTEGDLWVGTSGGLTQLSDVKFAAESVSSDAGLDYTAAVAASARGGAWVGNWSGVTYFEGQTRRNFSTAAGLPAATVKRVFEARNGDLYLVSGLTTLAILSGEKVVTTHHASTLVVGMVEDAKSVVVSVGGGLYRAGREQFTPYVFSHGAPDFQWILNLAPGSDGAFWVASEKGIFRVKEGAFQKWSVTEGLPDPTVQTIMEDIDGAVWASTLAGVVRLKNGKIAVINRKDGLFDDNVYAIVPDDLGSFWIDSGRGIFRVTRQAMNDFADGKIHSIASVAYNGSDSVKSAEKTTTQERVGCKSLDGHIWFPSEKGVVTIDPAHIPDNGNPPVVQIDRMVANGFEIDRDRSVVVPPGRGDLEFHFVALSFSAPRRVRIRYQLEGYDKDWLEASGRRIASYTNLAPGIYTFRVTAANADGVWSSAGAAVAIELRPHLYQTIWFRVLAGAAILGAVMAAYRHRIRLMQWKQKTLQDVRDRLEEQVVHRTSELANVNSSLQTEIQGHKQTEAQLQDKQQSLEKEIEERKRMGVEVERVHRELLVASRQAGMAEVATGVLHNVGNVLNSVNVSATLVAEQVQQTKAANVAKVAALFEQNKADLANFMTNDARGRMIPAYLGTLAEMIASEQTGLVTELDHLRKNIEHIKDIVAMQQTYARTSGATETISMLDLMEDALRINSGSLARNRIETIRDYQVQPLVTIDKHKVMQILVNLIRNAEHACDESERPDKRITVQITGDERRIRIAVIDNGVGIPAENLARIFNHGFTTRKTGHGFGLHSGALAAREMGGSLEVRSDGPGLGATFFLELPYSPVNDDHENSPR